MKDGGVFRMPNELWQSAFDLECADPGVTIKVFKEITHKYWLKNRKSGKLRNKYRNEAEFGKEIMYNHIRHSFEAIERYRRAIEERRGFTPGVLVIQKDGGVIVYTGVSKKEYESISAYLAENKNTKNNRVPTIEEKIKVVINERIHRKAKKLFTADAKAGLIGPLLSKVSMSDENLKALGYWERAEKELRDPT